ncbi:MAG: hypothetical protein HDR26_09065 [Lachnospiraceae bacterium]|nr:hypothetical protein [Lachnospiraceae bacterium]
MKKISTLICLCTAVLLCLSLTACGDTKTSITIDGKEVALNATIQECLDNGLVITDVSGFETTLTQELRAREVSYDGIYLGNNQYPQRCPVYVHCYNKKDTPQDIKECKIMDIHYSARFDSADLVPVLVKGIDFWGMTEDEVIPALEAQGLKPEKVHDTLIRARSGNVTWSIELEKGLYFNSDSKNPLKPVIEFDSDTLYVSDVEISIRSSLNITFK